MILILTYIALICGGLLLILLLLSIIGGLDLDLACGVKADEHRAAAADRVNIAIDVYHVDDITPGQIDRSDAGCERPHLLVVPAHTTQPQVSHESTLLFRSINMDARSNGSSNIYI